MNCYADFARQLTMSKEQTDMLQNILSSAPVGCICPSSDAGRPIIAINIWIDSINITEGPHNGNNV